MNFKIDKLATEFERKWAPNCRVFEPYLDKISSTYHKTLLLELVPLDVELATNAGIKVIPDQYDVYGTEVMEIARRAILELQSRPDNRKPGRKKALLSTTKGPS